MHACVFVFVYNSLLLVCSLALLVRLLSSFFILSHFAVEYIYCRKEAEEKKKRQQQNKCSCSRQHTAHSRCVCTALTLWRSLTLCAVGVCLCVCWMWLFFHCCFVLFCLFGISRCCFSFKTIYFFTRLLGLLIIAFFSSSICDSLWLGTAVVVALCVAAAATQIPNECARKRKKTHRRETHTTQRGDSNDNNENKSQRTRRARRK